MGSISTDLSLLICPDPAMTTSSSFESVSTDLSLAICPPAGSDHNSPTGFQAESSSSVSTDLPLGIICPVPISMMRPSFVKKFVVDDLNMVPFEDSPKQDSAKKSKRSRFATLQEEEDYYSQEIQNLYMNKCVSETTNYKACAPSSTKNDNANMKTKRRRISKKKDRGELVSNEATDKLRRFINEEMNGVDMKLVIQKKLYATDLNPTQNRLNMPINQIETHEFLKPDEKEFLETLKKNQMEVRLVGPKLQMYTKSMNLKLWHMERTCNYVLITNWNHFVRDNKEELKEGTKIQVWSFRKNQQLCFAIAIVGRPDDTNKAA